MDKSNKVREEISKNENLKIGIKNEKLITILLSILLVIFCSCIVHKTFQNDTYYTIKIGESISNNGIDFKDNFSWHEDLKYTYPHWLYDYATYIIYSKFGFTGIYILTCILSSTLGLILYHTCKKITKTNLISFIVAFISISSLIPFITARAQLVTFIIFAIEIFCIEMFLKSNKKIYATILLILPILLANLHVAVFPFYFVIYLPYIAEYMIYNNLYNLSICNKEKKYLQKKINKINKDILKSNTNNKINKKELIDKKESLQDKLNNLTKNQDMYIESFNKKINNSNKVNITKNNNIKKLVVIMILAIFAGFITPIKLAPYTYLLNTMLGNTTSYIAEHLPMVLVNHNSAFIYLFTVIGILVLTKCKIRLSDLFMLTGLVILMLFSSRQLSILILLTPFLIIRILKSGIENYSEKGTLKIEKILSRKLCILSISIVVVILSIVYMYKIRSEEYIDKTQYPVYACTYIKENLDLNKIKIFNEYNYGSYMLFNDIPVFIDSRAELYAPEFNNYEYDIFTEYMNIQNFKINYKEKFKKYGITHVILNKASQLFHPINNDYNYTKIYNDDNFYIYEIINK